jgi:hypothetical protein
VNKIEMTSISFNPNKMEFFLISFTSGDISEDKEQEITTYIERSYQNSRVRNKMLVV